MKALFIHDNMVTVYQNKYYGNGSLTAKTFNRYLNVFDSLTVATRQEIAKDKNHKGYTPLDTNGVYFEKIPEFSSLSSVVNFLKAKRKICQLIKEHDIIIIRLPSFNGLLAYNICKKYKKKMIIEVVGYSKDVLKMKGMIGSIIALPFDYLMKKYVKNAEFVVYVTKEYLQRQYPTKGKSTNASNVNIDTFEKEKYLEKRESYTKVNTQSELVFGSIGDIDQLYKGHDKIIDVLPKIMKQRNQIIRYELVGGGSGNYLQPHVKENSLEKNVKFMGSMSQKEVLSWLDTIDIYLQPSLTEGLPRAVIEAMSRGLVCIGSDRGGIPELLDKSVIIPNIESLQEVEKTIMSVLDGDLVILSANNWEHSKEYSYDIISKRLLSFYREVVNSSSGLIN